MAGTHPCMDGWRERCPEEPQTTEGTAQALHNVPLSHLMPGWGSQLSSEVKQTKTRNSEAGTPTEMHGNNSDQFLKRPGFLRAQSYKLQTPVRLPHGHKTPRQSP